VVKNDMLAALKFTILDNS